MYIVVSKILFRMQLKTRHLPWLIIVLFLGISTVTMAQDEVDHSYTPLKVNLDESGSKYIRFIVWHQQWLTTNNLSADDSKLQVSSSIRRSRFLAYAQVSPKFLILTHFGLNGLNSSNLSSLGNNSDSPQLFLHGAWGELKVNDQLYIGSGLHYWKGLTRLANQSTLNFMTLDQSRPFNAWHSLGITDQFARHLGIYAKGAIDKFDYRIAWNTAGRNPLGDGRDYSANFNENGAQSSLLYQGASTLDSDGNPLGNSIVEGYFRYNFWDSESTKLPYIVGTYLGKKKVFAIGAGFFLHPNGMYDVAASEHVSVNHFAVDAYLDMPTSGGAINAYAAFQSFDYGENYISRWGGTGTAIYSQVGYYLAAAKIMPYAALSVSSYDGADENITATNIGVNYYVNGHHAKVTAEYHRIANDYREGAINLAGGDALSQVRVQLHIFL